MADETFNAFIRVVGFVGLSVMIAWLITVAERYGTRINRALRELLGRR